MVEKRFRVVAVHSAEPLIVLRLRSDAEMQAMKASHVVMPANEDEKMAKVMGTAVLQEMKMIPGFGEAMKPPASSLILTVEEYVKLGKPTVGDEITLQLKFKREPIE